MFVQECTHSYRATFRNKGNSVCDQVNKNLREATFQPDDVWRRLVEIRDYRYTASDRQFRLVINQILQHLDHVYRNHFVRRKFCIQTRGIGDVGDEAIHPVHIVADDIHQAFACGIVGDEAHGFNGGAQRGQRVFKLVGHVGRKSLVRFDTVVKGGGHVA